MWFLAANKSKNVKQRIYIRGEGKSFSESRTSEKKRKKTNKKKIKQKKSAGLASSHSSKQM